MPKATTGLRITVRTKQLVFVESVEHAYTKVAKWMDANKLTLVDHITNKDNGDTIYIGERTLGEIKVNLSKTGFAHLKIP